MFGTVGITELLIILGVALLIFGPKQLPKLGRAMGETINSFKSVRQELQAGLDEAEGTVKDIEQELKS